MSFLSVVLTPYKVGEGKKLLSAKSVVFFFQKLGAAYER